MSEQQELTFKYYLDSLAAGKLVGSRCKKCGKIFVPPKIFCSECNGTEFEQAEFSGKGELATFSLVHVGTRYFASQGYKMRKPYCFGVVKLEEGVHVSGHVVGPTQDWEFNPDNFKVGMPVKVKILKVEIEGKEPKFDLGFEPA